MHIDISKVVAVLQNGGVVVFPTDTVYGLLCDATNEQAVEKLCRVKERPAGKAISIFVSDFEMAQQYIELTPEAERTLHTMLPGPYTVVLPSKHRVARALESEKGTLGIRIPRDERILELVRAFGKPVTATSANLASQPPHYSIESFEKQIGVHRRGQIDLVVNGGKLPYRKPSTVVDFTTGDIQVLRRGDIDPAKVRAITTTSEQETRQVAQQLLQDARKQSADLPIVFMLQGDLGAGKTIFAKGLGEYLGVRNIISPTFVVYYEYPIEGGKFLHADLYNVGDREEFQHLGLASYLTKGNVLCIEWSERADGIIERLRGAAQIISVTINHVSETTREIISFEDSTSIN